MIHYKVYSSLRTPECDTEVLREILRVSVERNEQERITGVLLHCSLGFLQYIEGGIEPVNRLYDRIKNNNFHKTVTLLNSGISESRLFPSWAMGSIDLNDHDVVYNSLESEIHLKTFQKILQNRDLPLHHAKAFIKALRHESDWNPLAFIKPD